MTQKDRRAVVCVWVWGLCGVALVATGCALIPVFQDLYHEKIKEALPLKNGTEAYKNWLSPPAPVYFQVWVLHVANHREVVQDGATPVLIERGPYTYSEKRRKVGVQYTDNDTISYREDVWFHFDPHKSVGNDTDTFTTINLPMLTIATLLRYQYGFVEELADLVLDAAGEHLFLELSVAQLLWGYEDPLLKDIKQLLLKYHVHLSFNDTFGLFSKQNGSDNGVFRMYTGLDSTDRLADIESWNGYRSLPYWNGSFANMINGSDGTKYPPFVDLSRSYFMFSAHLCRSLEITYNDTYELKGIQVARFTIPKRVLGNITDNPDNWGFCTPRAPTNCLPAGLLNASVCRDGAPLVFSQPHFLDGDPVLLKNVVGMKPRRSQHQVFIDIEPTTGMVMHLGERLQINVYLQNISHIRETYSIREPIFLPVLWINETAVIDEKSAEKFKDEVQRPLLIMQTIQYGLVALGIFILGCVMFMYTKTKFSNKDTEHTEESAKPSETTPILMQETQKHHL